MRVRFELRHRWPSAINCLACSPRRLRGLFFAVLVAALAGCFLLSVGSLGRLGVQLYRDHAKDPDNNVRGVNSDGAEGQDSELLLMNVQVVQDAAKTPYTEDKFDIRQLPTLMETLKNKNSEAQRVLISPTRSPVNASTYLDNTRKTTLLVSDVVKPSASTLRKIPHEIRKIGYAPVMHYTPTRYRKDIPAMKRYLKYLAKVEDALPEMKRAVIILTNHRSGSSFFGELFNQHPDAFYIFEPLFPLSNSFNCALHRDMKIEILKDLIGCSLPDMMKVYKEIPVKERLKGNKNMKLCLQTGMCFRMNTKEMCEDRHCPRTNSASIKSCEFDCGAVNRGMANNDCRRKNLVALKIIRLCDINDIEYVISSKQVDVKIIHLLRDPRGIASSRLRIMKGVNLSESIEGTCNRQAHNLRTGLVNTPTWLKGRYMVIRYEDVSLSPYTIAHSVYNFVGLSFPEEMKQWIHNSTGIAIPSEMKISNKKAGGVRKSSESSSRQRRATPTDAPVNKTHLTKSPSRQKTMNPYGTSRDSANMVQNWVKHLPYTTVRMVENTCASIMKMAAYKQVPDKEIYAQNKTLKYFSDEMPVPSQLNGN